ncbi:PREDICTED: taste receptor type 2 member 40-like [Gekko japonicus]|uniref:Taste receptor type 2 member 40 n=1 Tax=Gekko japonicus TaxID=146911 RepID=A0ABM1JP65_GEKJA|nr:PREDICTED: taste receptor type 2 member 40-like [Gekko japonicus]
MISFFKQAYNLNEFQLMINIMWTFTNNVSLWFAAWLSVLYFVKITIFSHPFFLQMKQRFSRLLPWLLLGSVVFSAMHIEQVRCNGTGIEDLSTQAHLSAIKVLAFFAVLYLSSFVAVALRSELAWKRYEHNWISILLETVGGIYPSGHAIILIINNPKLKQAWMQMLHHLKCSLSEASS